MAVATFAVFGQTIRFGYVNFDDEDYCYGNPRVESGLSWHNAAWAFQIGYAANWHPLTWLSLMLDTQLFGNGPAGHHFTNVVLHMAGSLLLFLVLRRMTGALWPCAFTAAVFALHPLHVESVAWISERKDVLSGFFFMLTLWMYARHAEQSRAHIPTSWRFYVLSLVFFTAGLMSKPMLVTLPFLLLLLDYWPLQRVSAGWFPAANRKLIWEKIPFLALGIATCVVTMLAQSAAVRSTETLPFMVRVGNAAVSCVAYLGQMVFPVRLAAFYPYTVGALSSWKIIGSLIFLAGVTVTVLVLRRSRPFLLVGWLWYLGMLVPVIGLVQVGGQARADRYTYLPLVGVFIMLAWSAGDLTASWRHRRSVLGVAALVVISACMACAFIQTSHWRNGESLWTHTLACTSGNFTAEGDLGSVLASQGRNSEAIVHYRAALAINPRYIEAYNNLGIALARQGQTAEAIQNYRTALKIKPDSAEAHINLGNALAAAGQSDEAIEHFTQAVQFQPASAEAHNDWGAVLLSHGSIADATEQFQKAIALRPDYAEAQNNLGTALAQQHEPAEAIEHYQKALSIKPAYAKAHYNLANILAGQGQIDAAIQHYEQTVALMPDFNHARYQLAILLQSRGQFAAAIAQFQKIIQLDPRQLAAQNNLAWLLATCPDASQRDGKQAVELALPVAQSSKFKSPEILDTLAAAYAEAGQFGQAVETLKYALTLDSLSNTNSLVTGLQSRLKLYEAGLPYHESR